MVLPIFAAVLHACTYYIYANQVIFDGTDPNFASWTVWAFLSVLNAVTFWKGTKSLVKASQFIVGSVSVISIWIITYNLGGFSPIGKLEVVIMLLGVSASLVWWRTGVATYASVLIGFIYLVSFIPTFVGVIDGTADEVSFTWYMWAVAFAATSLNIYLKRHEEHELHWSYMMFVPLVLLFSHLFVGVYV